MPQIARAAAGPAWREMSDDQRTRYSDAFADYLSRVYARRFGEYGGESVEIGRSRDQGKRGVMVSSTVIGSGEPIAVDWLVTDRPGRVVIADIVIENVSLVITQRDEIAGLFERNGRDPEKLIAALKGI